VFKLANALTSVGSVNPEFDVGHGDWGCGKVLKTPFHAILADAVAPSSLIATFGFCAGSGIANAVSNSSNAPIERKMIFIGIAPFQSFRVRLTKMTLGSLGVFTTF
jgi:hypothetical protein